MDKREARKYLEYVLSGIEAEYQDKTRSARQWREQEIENAHKDWSPWLERDESGTGVADEAPANGTSAQESPQTHAKTNGSGGRTIPTEVIRRYVHEILKDPSVEIVTQTEIKDRLLREYPDAKIPSVRSGIANELQALRQSGYLELVEEGRAGQPNKYRRTGKAAEASLLEP